MRARRSIAIGVAGLAAIIAGLAIRWRGTYEGAVGAVGALFAVSGAALLAVLAALGASRASEALRAIAWAAATIGGLLLAFALVQTRPRDCTHGFTDECGLTEALLTPPAWVLALLLLSVPFMIGWRARRQLTP